MKVIIAPVLTVFMGMTALAAQPGDTPQSASSRLAAAGAAVQPGAASMPPGQAPVTRLAAAAAPAQLPPSTAPEAATPPSEVSVRQLLEVMQARKMVDRMSEKIDSMFSATIQNMLKGKTLTPEQQQSIDAARARMDAMMKEVFNWEAMEPMYLQVYTQTFSQSEIDSMTTFYSSPAGQAVVSKLPLAMENSMALMQQRMLTLLPKMQQVAKDAAEQVKAKDQAAAKSAS
jgi:uncharacterized protein